MRRRRFQQSPPRSQSHVDTSGSGVTLASITHRSLGRGTGAWDGPREIGLDSRGRGWTSGSLGRTVRRAWAGPSSCVDGVQGIAQWHLLAVK